MTTPDAGKRTSLKVRIWSITSYDGANGTTYTVRWLVAGKKFPATFATRRLAETFRAKLLTAAREGIPFDSDSGLPPALAPAKDGPTWYEHACAYVDMKWPHASGRHRRSISEALATVTPALLTSDHGAPEPAAIRHTLTTWSFNAMARKEEPTTDIKQTADWIAANSVKLAGLAEAATIR